MNEYLSSFEFCVQSVHNYELIGFIYESFFRMKQKLKGKKLPKRSTQRRTFRTKI